MVIVLCIFAAVREDVVTSWTIGRVTMTIKVALVYVQSPCRDFGGRCDAVRQMLRRSNYRGRALELRPRSDIDYLKSLSAHCCAAGMAMIVLACWTPPICLSNKIY